MVKFIIYFAYSFGPTCNTIKSKILAECLMSITLRILQIFKARIKIHCISFKEDWEKTEIIQNIELISNYLPGWWWRCSSLATGSPWRTSTPRTTTSSTWTPLFQGHTVLHTFHYKSQILILYGKLLYNRKYNISH